jgi:hypothetical protein
MPKSAFTNYRGQEISLVDFVQVNLDGSDYGQGQLEDLAGTSKNIVEAFARFLEVLSDKNLLTDDEVHLIIKGY